MSALPIIGFVLIALLAIGFAVVPLLRAKTAKGRALLLAAIALFMLGIGGGTYWMVGQPRLAQREAIGLQSREVNALIPFLIERVRKAPNDARAWRYLAQAYMSANDPGDAARAFAQVIRLTGKGDAEIDAAYGEALVMQNRGSVPADAEAAFSAALAVEPRNAPARFYLGLARSQHNDRQGAIAYWQSLLADTPFASPLHQMLLDRLALLTAQGLAPGSGGAPGQGGAPDPRAMVARLAARLKADPQDGPGWIRLVRAYHVLGEDDKAKDALRDARKAFVGDKAMLAAFDTAQKDLK